MKFPIQFLLANLFQYIDPIAEAQIDIHDHQVRPLVQDALRDVLFGIGDQNDLVLIQFTVCDELRLDLLQQTISARTLQLPQGSVPRLDVHAIWHFFSARRGVEQYC